jgi:hypothetical protein
MNQKLEQKQGEVVFDLNARSEEFLETFFRKGAEFTEQLLQEVQRSRGEIARLKEENIKLRSQLASDDAVRDLLVKVKELEEEKRSIRETADNVVREYRDYEGRYMEMEQELDQMANLYVASAQLHVAMDPSEVFSVIEQMLMQFVGAAKIGIFLRRGTDDAPALVPVHAFHCDAIKGSRIEWNQGSIGECAATQVSYVMEPGSTSAQGAPIACIPLLFGTTTIGVIAIYGLLEQKKNFVRVDYELFRLLAEHSSSAIIGSGLFSRSENLADVLGCFEGI